jgi:hypothetical protein
MITNVDQIECYEWKLKIKWYLLNEIINCLNFIICFKWNVYSRKNVLKMMNYLRRKSWFLKSVQEDIFKDENKN